MISKDKYEKYYEASKQLIFKDQHICWHCWKITTNEDTLFRIEKLMPAKNHIRKYQTLHFHASCFIQVAGNDYDLEMDHL